MASRNDSTTEERQSDGPGLALSILYEAADLFKIFRTHLDELSGHELTSGEITLALEINRRIDSAISHLDGAVPHPADDESSLHETVARNIRMLADQNADPKVSEQAKRFAAEIEREGNGADKEPGNDRFAIPELLSKRHADRDRWVHDVLKAGSKHGKHLRKAEGRLFKAKGLAETLRCALLSDDYEAEPFADMIVASIIDELDKAELQMDRHSRRHSNLFLAHFDRDRPAAGGAE